MKKTICIVDDNTTNITVAENALNAEYRVVALTSAAQMFMTLEMIKPDLILLDIEMPEINGLEAMKRLKADPSFASIPVIFLTSLSDPINESYGIELGAVDFITKPFSVPVLLTRIKNHLHIDDLIRKRTEQLLERTEQLIKLQNGILFVLADIVGSRDRGTGGHIERTAVYTDVFVNAMLERGVYTDELLRWDIESVVSSARLHDVGKIAIPDTILNKPGALTKKEFEIMKTHAAEGARIIENAMQRTGDVVFLQNAKLFAEYHHERWDGSGYPYSLKGTKIPLHGRVMAVIDVYDALISERLYKKAFSHEEAVKIIMDDSGKHFDPLIVNVFDEIHDKMKTVR